eukprot:GHVU01053306.1.p1 GENE.GHVU01053306.1~~GHVU01053306.1.p1  ORF type:complete len:189 (-),score=41.46 GHVU01053306.1:393-959(-)
MVKKAPQKGPRSHLSRLAKDPHWTNHPPATTIPVTPAAAAQAAAIAAAAARKAAAKAASELAAAKELRKEQVRLLEKAARAARAALAAEGGNDNDDDRNDNDHNYDDDDDGDVELVSSTVPLSSASPDLLPPAQAGTAGRIDGGSDPSGAPVTSSVPPRECPLLPEDACTTGKSRGFARNRALYVSHK